MSESFSLSAYWAQGDFVSHAVALILILLSVASWAVIGAKGWQIYRLRRQSGQLVESFWQAANFEDGLIRIQPIAPFAFIAQRAAQAVRHFNDHSTDAPHLDAHLSLGELVTRSLRQGISRASSQLENGLTFLASIGSTAPFIGLFGTVWGIYHALASIGATGQASLDKVAGPVGEALIMTAAGLFVAIPAVLAYNAFSRGLRVVSAELDAFATDLHTYFTTGRAIATTQGKGQRLTGVM
ncbi:MAG TPA: MotA/TolQ/ExbB proton channel family protein [Rhodocyclaceae bacterium]|nr:MotA/TolQ/ExbB proton channel family protein [Rhodocyclaceae bacterium]